MVSHFVIAIIIAVDVFRSGCSCCSVLVVGLVDFFLVLICVGGRGGGGVTGKHFINIVNSNIITSSIKTIVNTLLSFPSLHRQHILSLPVPSPEHPCC